LTSRAGSARRGVLLVAAALLAACGSDDSQPVSKDGLPPDEYALDALMQDIFVPTCSSGRCHTAGIATGGLILDANLVENTVGVVSRSAPPRVLVVAGDPDASYLLEKLESDTPAAGARMPLTGPLPPRDIARIRAWIAALTE
jgi:hypothetical protein